MAINIYDELLAQAAATKALEARVKTLETVVPPLPGPSRTLVAPVSYFRYDKKDAAGRNAWDALIAKKPALAMINPGSGPGLGKSDSYATLVARVQAAGIPIFGYVHTKYGNRPLAEVKADILNHKTWYGLKGIFVDTTSNKAEHLAYYTDLCSYIHGLGLKACLNPGTQTIEDHAKIADYVMVSEGDLATYNNRTPRVWEINYPGKMWHCVHTVSASQMPSVVALAKKRGAGLLFVTPDVMPNPYDMPPANWDAFCDEVAK